MQSLQTCDFKSQPPVAQLASASHSTQCAAWQYGAGRTQVASEEHAGPVAFTVSVVLVEPLHRTEVVDARAARAGQSKNDRKRMKPLLATVPVFKSQQVNDQMLESVG